MLVLVIMGAVITSFLGFIETLSMPMMLLFTNSATVGASETIVTSGMLVSLAAILAVNLTGAIDTLMTQAKTPHFMQIHSGKIDIARLEAFAKRNSDVNEFQVLEFLNADGTAIIIGRNSLSGNITQVSGGQLQRAGICRALMNNPKIIFGDEPTGSLNSKSAQKIISLFSEINANGTAVMLLTHDVNVAVWAERILFMRNGKIVNEIRLSKFNGADINDRIKKVTAKMRKIDI